jgi:hypothetical protein
MGIKGNCIIINPFYTMRTTLISKIVTFLLLSDKMKKNVIPANDYKEYIKEITYYYFEKNKQLQGKEFLVVQS